MSSYDPAAYEERQARNERSREWATRDRQPWTAAEDAVILDRWVKTRPADRDELAVSQAVERTIEACRFRAHYLAGVHTGVRYNKDPQPKPVERYDWMAEWEQQTGSAPITGW